MEDTNVMFKLLIDNKEHDLIITKENLAALAAGAFIHLEGKVYFPKITIFMGATTSNYYLDNKPLLELIENKETQ